MLALADDTGYVGASVSGLARQARVPKEKTREALDKFMAPDEDSRNSENDGRRIEVAPRGWRILNYDKFPKIGGTNPVPAAQTVRTSGRPMLPCPEDLVLRLESIGEVDKLAARYAVDRLDIIAEVNDFVDYWTSPDRTEDQGLLSDKWFTRIRNRIGKQATNGFLRGRGHNLNSGKPSKAADLMASQRARVERLGGKV